jgi:hypothetical protein
MLWILTAIALVAGAAALIALMFSKRPVHVKELGAVSERWIAEHRVDQV